MAIIQTFGSANNNINVGGSADDTTEITDFGGEDTYTILPDLEGDVELTDNDASTINLPEGLTIDDANFLSNGVQFTINGNVLTLLGNVANFTFVFGGDPIDPTLGTEQTFSETAQAFGTSVPAPGDPANSATNTGAVQSDGSIGTGSPPSNLTFTNNADDLTGTEESDTFDAPLVQEGGLVSNSLASGDSADGQEGTDVLTATIVPESGSPVIAPETQSIENVFFTAQEGGIDGNPGDPGSLDPGTPGSDDISPTIDAGGGGQDAEGGMIGVRQWWSSGSRNDLRIESVQTLPEQATIGMRGTDPQVDYTLEFDSQKLVPQQDSLALFQFSNLDNPGDELFIGNSGDGWVEALTFTLNGQNFTLGGSGTDIDSATTYSELLTAVQDAIANNPQLSGNIQASLDTSFTAPSPPAAGQAGAELQLTATGQNSFSEPTQIVIDDAADAGALLFRSPIGDEDDNISTNVVLDKVGRFDWGGDLNVGGMKERGVDQFDVQVDRTSWLNSLKSQSREVNPNTQSDQHLNIVNVSHLADGAEGDLVIGEKAEKAVNDGTTLIPNFDFGEGGEGAVLPEGVNGSLDLIYAENALGGATGSWTLDNVDTEGPIAQTDEPVTENPELPTGGRVVSDVNEGAGLIDVREFNAEGFTGNLNIGAALTEESLTRYLDEAADGDDPISNFSYLLGNGNNILTMNINQTLSSDPFFDLEIVGGEQNDRINLTGNFDFNSISVDGGAGDNIIEVQSSLGVDDASTPANFGSFQTLVLASPQQPDSEGDITVNPIDVDMENVPGVEELVIATGYNGGIPQMLPVAENTPDTPPSAFFGLSDTVDIVDTTVQNLNTDQTETTISGKKQTLADGAADQQFGNIVFEDAAAGTLNVNIENTGRADAELTINEISAVSSESDGSTPETVVLNSTVPNPDRATNQFNRVQNFTAPATTELFIEGVTDFGINIDNLGQDLDDDQEILISAQNPNGTDFEGDLTVGIDTTSLTAGSDDELIGAIGENDRLVLSNADSITSTTPSETVETTVEDFETVQLGYFPTSDAADELGKQGASFGVFSGTYDASNTNGVETYIVGAFASGETLLDNLSGDATVYIGDPSGPDDQELGSGALILSGPGGGAIDVNIPDDKLSSTLFSPAELRIDNFETINLDFGVVNSDDDGEDLPVRLKLDGEGNVEANGNPLENSLSADFDDNVRELIVTGGSEGDEDNLILGDSDFGTATDNGAGTIGGGTEATGTDLDLQALPASLTTIDFSDYEGTVQFALADADDPDDNTSDDGFSELSTDTTIALGDDNAQIALTDGVDFGEDGATADSATNDASNVNFNTTFQFTESATGSETSDWIIHNFVEFDNNDSSGGGLNNATVLDLSELGVDSFADLTFGTEIVDGRQGATIQETGNDNWQITLIGVDDESDLSAAENFIFA